MDIGGIRLPKLGTHPLLLHAELNPQHEEYEDETDDPAHLRERDCGAKKPGQNACVDGGPALCVDSMGFTRKALDEKSE